MTCELSVNEITKSMIVIEMTKQGEKF